jgi:hypothetical protein
MRALAILRWIDAMERLAERLMEPLHSDDRPSERRAFHAES